MAGTVAVVVPSYNGVRRLDFMLQTVVENDLCATEVPWLIVEDPCPIDGVREAYDELCDRYSIPIEHLPDWSNMHGAARKAFDLAFKYYDPDWVIYLGDDLAVTPGSLSNLIHFVTANPLNTVALVQSPYWNAQDLCRTEEGQWDGYLEGSGYKKPFWGKEGFYAGMDWVRRVPRNPHWDDNGIARPYINVNGCGFAAHAASYRSVGGFATGTWCLDESISVRTWLLSDKSIVCIPGPPLVHYFGASLKGHHVKHDAFAEYRWVEDMGMSKSEADGLCRQKMAEREAVVMEEMARCSYGK